ncbi:MAG: DUF4468 domain-containing protein [Prevotella sp.]|nr:DUF4468 domain-containing protein [Prevotella sp.]
MRKIVIALIALLPLLATAQNTWEMPEEQENALKTNPDQKYLVGAVPVVNGQVVFQTTIAAPGKSARQIYDILHAQMAKMLKEKNQFEQSRFTIENPEKGELAAYYQEWLVFKNKPLVLDRTRLMFNLTVVCKDGSAEVTINRIHYLYDEERNATTYRAEEWITDEYGLKKDKQKLSRVSGKFRRKTIDRKDYIFDKFATLLK